jgi:ATP-binding cassette subfamily B protein
LSDHGIYAEVIRRMSQHLWRFVFAIAGVAMGAAMEVLKPWPLKVLIDNVLSGKPLQFAPLASYSKMNLLIAACVGGVLI